MRYFRSIVTSMKDAIKTSILIADDHAMLRESMSNLLKREKDFEVVNTQVRMKGYCADCRKKREQA